MYSDRYSETIIKKLAKLKKKDAKHYVTVRKKMDWILSNPEHRYKLLHYTMKGINRIHIGHFVLTFIIDHKKKIVSFEDYDHHDKIYR
jgi:mRNA-degrading endonuclease RelE of RelBE toxin-antitoxin system